MNKDDMGSVLQSLVLISQVAIAFMAPVFLMLFIGIKIDGKYNTNWAILLLIIGIAAGFLSVYKLIKPIITKKSSQELKKQKEDEYVEKVLEDWNQGRLSNSDKRSSK